MLAQWGLHRLALISPLMVATSPLLGGLLLIAAGAYQWTPLKQACLRHCRTPLQFLTSENDSDEILTLDRRLIVIIAGSSKLKAALRR